METPIKAIRDFLKAVDRGYLGQMPSGFNDSAFVKALRDQAADYLSHGDAREWERLLDLGEGHVLTARDVTDIRALCDDYNDEIGNASNAYGAARENVLREIGGDDLVKAAEAAAEWQSAVAVSRAFEHFHKKSAEYRDKAKSSATA